MMFREEQSSLLFPTFLAMRTDMHTEHSPHWWRNAVIYQIYPKSFQDSGAKGTGDLQGIIQRLDYLQQLGVEALWLTPVYPSPQIDNGYDIADYRDIDPRYGTLADFDALVAAAHARGLRIIMDMVVNHTSTAHPWFQQALADPGSPYRDYYIWRDPVSGGAPNNWQSKFGGSAWQLDPHSGQYYLHLFAVEQADLNWENPHVRAEVKAILHFWADRGVDGFRLDVINLISKQQDFPDDNSGDGRRFYTDGPRIHEFLQELNREVFTPRNLMTVGEMSSTTLEHCQRYSSRDGKELSMVFNFHHLKVDYADGEKWRLAPFDLVALKQIFCQWQQGLHGQGWNALFWCNHDQPRLLSRLGVPEPLRLQGAKLLATSLYLLQGTPYLYQGEEIGMTDPGFSRLEQYRDIESLNLYALKRQQGLSDAETLALLAARSRDNSRTPMQWDDSAQGGFTQVQPWIELASNHQQVHVAAALGDPDSVLHYYRALIALRKRLPLLLEGDYQDLLPAHPQLWCYRRQHMGQTLTVLCNWSAQEVALPAEVARPEGELLSSNYADLAAALILRPYEAQAWLSSQHKQLCSAAPVPASGESG